MAQLTRACEDYLATFPQGTRFRITDIAQRFWSNDMLAWSFDPDIATHILPEDLADMMAMAMKYTNLPGDKTFIEAAPAGLKKSLLLNSSRL